MSHSATWQIRLAHDLAGIVDQDRKLVNSAKSGQTGDYPVLPDKWMSGVIACESRCADDLASVVDFYAALGSWAADSSPECAEGNHSAVLPKEWFLGWHSSGGVWRCVCERDSPNLAALVAREARVVS